ncbi:hypothetical protein MRB53_038405 [Persea americana]|nr:hypothetical protein MRB53_038405 [Persea americana]
MASPGGDLALRERELMLRQKELALREREMSLRNVGGPGAGTNDDPNAPTTRASIARPDGGNPSRRGFPPARPQPGRSRTSMRMMQDVPGPQDNLMDNPLLGYSSDRYGNVDRTAIGRESRTNSLTAARLNELQQGTGYGGYPPMVRRTSQPPNSAFAPGGRGPSRQGQPPSGMPPQVAPPSMMQSNGLSVQGRRPSPPDVRQPTPRHPPGHGNSVAPQQVEQRAGVSSLYPPKSGPQVRSLTGSASASAGSGDSGQSANMDSENSAYSSQSSLGPRPALGVRAALRDRLRARRGSPRCCSMEPNYGRPVLLGAVLRAIRAPAVAGTEHFHCIMLIWYRTKVYVASRMEDAESLIGCRCAIIPIPPCDLIFLGKDFSAHWKMPHRSRVRPRPHHELLHPLAVRSSCSGASCTTSLCNCKDTKTSTAHPIRFQQLPHSPRIRSLRRTLALSRRKTPPTPFLASAQRSMSLEQAAKQVAAEFEYSASNVNDAVAEFLREMGALIEKSS